jgi:hypothetical protein
LRPWCGVWIARVGAAEDERREHLLAVDVTREATGLSDERPDHVAVVDAVQIAAAKSLARELLLVRVPDLDPIFEDPHADPLAHEPRRD